MLMQDLKAQIAQATQDRDTKAETKAKRLQQKADAEGDLKDTTTTRDADSKYLADLTATCEESQLLSGPSCLIEFVNTCRCCRCRPLSSFLSPGTQKCQMWPS